VAGRAQRARSAEDSQSREFSVPLRLLPSAPLRLVRMIRLPLVLPGWRRRCLRNLRRLFRRRLFRRCIGGRQTRLGEDHQCDHQCGQRAANHGVLREENRQECGSKSRQREGEHVSPHSKPSSRPTHGSVSRETFPNDYSFFRASVAEICRWSGEHQPPLCAFPALAYDAGSRTRKLPGENAAGLGHRRRL
jgi:hypothetical protein